MSAFPVVQKPIDLTKFSLEQTLEQDRWEQERTAATALDTANFPILNLLAEHNILPDPKSIIVIAWRANEEVLTWIFNKGLFAGEVGVKAAVRAASWYKFEVIDWLANHGILPDHKAFSTFYDHDFDLIKRLFDWLKDRQIFPTSEEANKAKKQERSDVLALMATIEVYPDPTLPEKIWVCQ